MIKQVQKVTGQQVRTLKTGEVKKVLKPIPIQLQISTSQLALLSVGRFLQILDNTVQVHAEAMELTNRTTWSMDIRTSVSTFHPTASHLKPNKLDRPWFNHNVWALDTWGLPNGGAYSSLAVRVWASSSLSLESAGSLNSHLAFDSKPARA